MNIRQPAAKLACGAPAIYTQGMWYEALDPADVSDQMRALAAKRWSFRQDRRCRKCGALMHYATLARKFCGVRCRVAYFRAKPTTLKALKRAQPSC